MDWRPKERFVPTNEEAWHARQDAHARMHGEWHVPPLLRLGKIRRYVPKSNRVRVWGDVILPCNATQNGHRMNPLASIYYSTMDFRPHPPPCMTTHPTHQHRPRRHAEKRSQGDVPRSRRGCPANRRRRGRRDRVPSPGRPAPRHPNETYVGSGRSSGRNSIFELSTDPDVVRDLLRDVPTSRHARPGTTQRRVTTEGGLLVASQRNHLREVVSRLRDAGIAEVALFVDPDAEQIEAAAETGADCVELHTGDFALAKSPRERHRLASELARAAVHARKAWTNRSRRARAGLRQLCNLPGHRPPRSGSVHRLCRRGPRRARRHRPSRTRNCWTS